MSFFLKDACEHQAHQRSPDSLPQPVSSLWSTLVAYYNDFCIVFSPNKEVDEDDNREEGASGAGVSTEEQSKVTECTEHQHPQHLGLKKEVEAVHPSQHWNYMLHSGQTSWGKQTGNI